MRSVLSGAIGRLLVAGALLGVVGATSGCKKLFKGKKYDAGLDPQTSSTSASSTTDDPDDKVQDKVNEYIRCQNATSSAAWNSQRRYNSRIKKTGPTGSETFAYAATLPKDSITLCQTNTAKGKALTPRDAKLEAAGDAYLKAVLDVDGLMNQIYPYFENKDFRDDKWAKGKALHPQIMASFKAFAAADNELHAVLAGITKPLSQRTLARIEKEDGKKFYWNRLNTLNMAREVLEATNPPGEDDDIDLSLYTSALADYEKALDDLAGYGSGHKADLNDQKRAPSWPLAARNYDEFVKSATELRKSAKDFFRCVRDAPAGAKRPNGKVAVEKIKSCVEGKPFEVQDKVFAKYNEFIRTSNQYRFP
jgi:Protein of unknown function (DUF3829)